MGGGEEEPTDRITMEPPLRRAAILTCAKVNGLCPPKVVPGRAPCSYGFFQFRGGGDIIP